MMRGGASNVPPRGLSVATAVWATLGAAFLLAAAWTTVPPMLEDRTLLPWSAPEESVIEVAPPPPPPAEPPRPAPATSPETDAEPAREPARERDVRTTSWERRTGASSST
jgi:hypothetical protein